MIKKTNSYRKQPYFYVFSHLIPLKVLLLLNLPPESWHYYSKLLPTLAALDLLRLKDATSRTTNRGTKGDLDLSSCWMTPEVRYVDLYLILSAAAPQLFANEN
jgi:hypothetical protein